MPKFNVNYQNTIIYKFVCNDLNITDIYVGSTTDIRRRKQYHKSTCNNENSKNYNLKIYKTMREHGGFSNWTMLEVEKFPCNNKAECNVRERHWLESLNAKMNKAIPGRTNKEWKQDNPDYQKEWIQDNPDYHKDYHEVNKTHIHERKSKKITCICGCNYTNANKSQHIKSKKHLTYLNNQINSEIINIENVINNINLNNSLENI